MEYEIVNGVYKGPSHFEDSLDLRNTQITSLGNLKEVGGFLDLENTPIKDLGKLEFVGGDLDLQSTPINDLGSLKSVEGYLYFSKDEKYTGEQYQELIKEFSKVPYIDYPLFLNDKRTPIRLLVNQKLKDGVLN